MRKLILAIGLTLALVTIEPIYAQGQCQLGYKPGPTPGSCVPVAPNAVPEANSFVMLGAGLSVLGGFLVLRRKRLLRNQ